MSRISERISWLRHATRRLPVSGLVLSLLVAAACFVVPAVIQLQPDEASIEEERAERTARLMADAGFEPPGGRDLARLQNGSNDDFSAASAEAIVEWESDATPQFEAEKVDGSSLDCMLLPWDEVSIRSPVTGRIDAIHVERADVVEEGQLLVELDAALSRAELELAEKRAAMTATLRSLEARSALSRQRSQRAAKLYEKRAMPLDTHDEIQTESRMAKFELEEARDEQVLASLEYARAAAEHDRRQIRSPMDGIIVSRKMSVGEVVDEETVLEIARIDPLRVEVILPAASFGTIQPGMKAAVIPEILSDDVRIATVRIVDGIIDSASGTFGVALELPNPGFEIPGGLRCEIRFVGSAAASATPSLEDSSGASEADVAALPAADP